MKKNVIVMSAVVLLLPAMAAAQTAAQTAAAAEEFKMRARAAVELQGAVYSLTRTVESRTTKGRPYSADAVTESVQALADGNRIVNRSVTRIYRDGEGRTRREVIGPAGTPRSITISDPVAGTNYTLDPETKTGTGFAAAVIKSATVHLDAVKGTLAVDEGRAKVEAVRERAAQGGRGAGAGTGRGTAADTTVIGAQGTGSGGGGGRGAGSRGVPSATAVTTAGGGGAQGGGRGRANLGGAYDSNTKREVLPAQMIEGVTATGTRATSIIPAGQIGNLSEIRIVSEQWTSTDLQVLVMTKHSDPRSGETTYKLTNIVRAEPDPNLFTVPADYSLRTRR